MMRLSRFALGAAIAVVLAAGPVARAAEPDKLLPANSEFVFTVNVKQIIDSDIIKQYALEQLKQALQGADAQKMLTQLGLDPLKDVSKVVIGGSGTDQSDAKMLMIIHGKFDPEKLFKAAEAMTKKKSDNFTMLKDGKDTLFKYQPDTGNPVYATVKDEQTILAGTDRKLVTAALASDGKKAPVGKELGALIAKMDDKASLWVAAVVKDKLATLKGGKRGPIPPELKETLEKMDYFTLVVRITKDVALDVALGMKDANSAEELGKMIDEQLTQLRGIIPFLTASKPELKGLADAAKSIKSAVKDKAVTITGKLPGAAIGQALGKSD
ncbi:MAG TPA: hypothetical protein VGI99_09130 [Gemmataceae bacterium]|jgi:hypothetical protein